MLEFIRKYAKGFIAIIIIILIGIPFAFQGIQSYIGGGSAAAVATVNGVEITEGEFLQVYQQARQRLIASAGGKFDPDQIDEAKFKKSVLQQLVKDKLAVMQAMNSGFRVGDGQLAASIQVIDAFQADGKFDQEQYASTLRQQGYTERRFEEMMRQELVSSQVRDGINASVFITEHELKDTYRVVNQKRDVGYMVISAGGYINANPISDDDVKTYYEANRSKFSVPEKVKLEYIRLSQDEMANAVNVTDADLREYYEQQKGNFSTEEQRQVSHIMLKHDPDGKTKSGDLREKLTGIRKMIAAGSSFEEMAKVHSEDKGSAQKGGDLGMYFKDMMEKNFEQAVYSLEEGLVSDVIETSYGFHLVKLTKHVKSIAKPFTEVRANIEKDYRRKKIEDHFFEISDKLINLAYENPETLEVASQELELAIKETGFFDKKGGVGIAGKQKVISKAFNEEVLLQRLNSDVIEIGLNDLVVIRVKDHIAASEQPLDEVKQKISDVIRLQRAQDSAEQEGKKVVAGLMAKGNETELARSQKSQWVKKGYVGRDEKDLNPQVLNKLFVMPRPAADKFSITGVRLSTGDYAVVRLYAVKDADLAQAKKDELQQLRTALARLKSNAEYSDYLSDQYSKAKVVLNEGAL